MNFQDFSEESDASDEDYIPDSKIEDAVSEVESDGDPEDPVSDSEAEPKSKRGKRAKQGKTSRKKKLKVTDNKDQSLVEEKASPNEDQKKKADDLWADFMKDTGFKPKNSKSVSPSSGTSSKTPSRRADNETKTDTKKPSTIKVTEIFEFAGEEVKVEKEVASNSAEARLLSNDSQKKFAPRKSGGLGSVLSQLGRKQKISTLEKSKLDWDRFKKEENIEEELQIHNKGKDGYLDRQDFLQRADLRRFEIEKGIRDVERAKRFNSTI